MVDCATRCTSYRTDNVNNAWLDIRSHFGPITQVGSVSYTTDFNEWNTWAVAHSVDPVTDVNTFGKWLIWKCSYGTTNYGNLPTRQRDHVGISCIPCPFDADTYEEERSFLWLGYVPTTTVSHNDHYMKVTQKGSSWGFSCTYSGCPFYIDNGYPYFHS